ncbi:thiamine pyrophosphate-binding protein [Verminephrobacter eiseniae]|uniref:Thiamine pyrophosphate enzyme N-terminal TPP-binding domain-containing protein n=2 Tax=Verminephrobacter eiseniae TaxID=364317 RepID=A1WJE5_VEREI|nr:thiamine pyrophosphate-binding protein [Verminephrobacter eiseniae]ABM57752.1 hypothetical protein Veis_2000 [Verminephrobacter eiseniae EF01-2]
MKRAADRLIETLVSRHRSSVGPRWPSKRIAALHRLPIRSVLAARCALRCAPMAARSLRHLIGDATLVRHGVERIFHVPGESCLSVLDGLADGSPPVTADMSAATCRHESAAGVLALADACLTEGALRQALACGRAAVLAVRARLEHVSAAATMDELRLRRPPVPQEA